MTGHRRLLAVAGGALGGAAAIGLMEWLSTGTRWPLVAIPFATSIVLVMGSPEADAAQPRALVGGHLVATLVGLAAVHLTGPGEWTAALAVGLAMAAMHLTRTFHPPAGIDPLVVVLNNMPWDFLLIPVGAGALLLAAFAFAWHNMLGRVGTARRDRSWPARWW